MVVGEFTVVYMKFLSRPWLEELWEQVNKNKALFWDPVHADLENFVGLLFTPGSMFFEVYKFGRLTGILYFTNVDRLTDIQFHGLTFDRKLTDKITLVRKIISWLFDNFHIQRVEAAIPDLFTATIKFITRVGFVKEGVRRKAVIYKGRWKDQAIFSVTREEVCRF